MVTKATFPSQEWTEVFKLGTPHRRAAGHGHHPPRPHTLEMNGES